MAEKSTKAAESRLTIGTNGPPYDEVALEILGGNRWADNTLAQNLINQFCWTLRMGLKVAVNGNIARSLFIIYAI